MRAKTLGCGLLALILMTQPARAELIDLGNGMIYDTVQDLTWLQDTWYSRAEAPDACFDGQPGCFATRAGAEAWVDALAYGGLDDWRLPAYIPNRPSEFCPAFACSEGYSEVSLMLQSLGWHWGYLNSSRPDYIAGSTGPFLNFQSTYWLGAPGYWWSRHEDVFLPDHYGTRAWAVRDGMARVPEPSTLILLALGGLGLLSRFGRSQVNL